MWSFNTKWSDFPTTSGVYAIVNTLNGKKYVGSTKCFKERFAEHRSQLRKGNHKTFIYKIHIINMEKSILNLWY
jgi:predicted GIY-YIG superfamily endonuclease